MNRRMLAFVPVLLAVWSAWMSRLQGAEPRAQDRTETLTHEGVKRTYHIHCPPGHDTKTHAPLVLALHGGGGQGSRFQKSVSGGTLVAAADARGVVLVFPDGIDKHWCDGRTEHLKTDKVYDDVGFIAKIMDRMIRDYGIDPKRIYATGISNGGFMSIRLALDLSERLAAVAPVTAQVQKIFQQRSPKLPISIMFVNGTADPLVPYGGGEIRLFKFGRSRGEILSTAGSIEQFRRYNGCAETPRIQRFPDRDPNDGATAERVTYAGGKDGTEVILIKVLGGGHTWPGGVQYLRPRFVGTVCRDINASEMILDFLLRHTRDTAPAPIPSTAADGAAGAKVQTLEFPDLVDTARENRSVPIKVHVPTGAEALPLVIYSHGGMGTWDSHLYEAEYLAGHGYVVFCLEHVYSNNKKTKEHARSERGNLKARYHRALLRITRDPKAVLGRARDVSFAIDRAVEWNQGHTQLKGRIDTSKIAVAGHSFGAHTVLTVCGARPILDYLDPSVPPGKGLAEDLSDPRVTVGIAMSPQGPGTSRFSPESYKSIKRPLLCFSGSKDDQFGYDGSTQPARRRIEGFQLMPPGDKILVWMENVDHLAFADNPKSWLLPSAARKEAMPLVKAMTLAFCDLHLKGRKAAQQKLTREFADTFCGEVVTKITWYEK